MKHHFLIPTVILLLLSGFASPVNATETGQSMTDTQKQVLDTVLSMTTAFENRDLDGVLSHYNQDAVISFEPGNPTTGNAQIREQFSQFFAINPAFDYSGHKVLVTDDTALHIAPWDMKGTAPDGSEITDSGLSVSVLKRQPDNSWRIVLDDPYGAMLGQ